VHRLLRPVVEVVGRQLAGDRAASFVRGVGERDGWTVAGMRDDWATVF